MTLYLAFLCLAAAYGFVRLVQDVVFGTVFSQAPALPDAEEEDDAELDLALAEHGVTVESDEQSVTAVTVDGVRISGPELTFELPDHGK